MRLIYSLLLILSLSCHGFGQKAMEINEVDIDRLKKEVHDDLMLFRDTNNIAHYVEDPILDNAAKMQGEYCLKNKTTSHYHKSEKLKKVEHRVRYFGGYHGNLHEIIAEINVSHVRAENYHQLSELTLRNALRNKAYNKFLRSKRGSDIGLYLDKNKTSIYMVIVLGTPPVFSDKYKMPKGAYGIKKLDGSNSSNCTSCEQLMKEVYFDPAVIGDSIYFAISDEKYLRRLFVNKSDGIAVDIIRKVQYPCGDPNVLSEGVLNNGYLMPPVYKKDILDHIIVNEQGLVFAPIGVIPEEWRGEEYELNLLLLQNNVLCKYMPFFQIPFGDSEPLDLEFDLNVVESDVQFEDKVNREMDFIIPFEQGKYTFDEQDLKPLIDSLRLASYNITSLDITAYSSIEGTKEKNIELQEKRANSIVGVISKNQSEEMLISIRTVENWVDFFHDVQKTDHAYLAGKSEEEVIEYVNNHRVASVDNVLAQHRKAVVKVSLERKNKIDEITETTLDRLFADTSFLSSDDKYLLIEDVYQTGSIALLKHLKVLVYANDQWNIESKGKIEVYLYQLENSELESVIGELSDLIAKKPESGTLMFNYCVLRLLSWEKNLKVEPSPIFKRQIWNDKVMSEENRLRLRLSFDILESIHYKRKRDVSLVNRSVKDALSVKTHLTFNDDEAFRMAKYFSNNGKYRSAIELLAPRVNKINVNEDVLFLYINLTIIDDKVVSKADYRTTLSNAAIVNKERFCTIFNSSFNRGITFQLLSNKYLKRSYCEICNN